MDTVQIENLSVNTVSSSLALSPYLEPYIAIGDKEPSYDGTVYIHDEPNKKKENLKLVKVQVKGRECEDFSNEKIKYSIEIAHLNNYRNNGGVILFVVYVNTDGESKIYYNALAPLKLDIILKNTDNQEYKSIELTEFPSDPFEKADVFLNFWNDSHMQTSFSGTELPSLEELEKSGGLKEISIHTSTFNREKGAKAAIYDNEIYLYALVTGSSIPQPIPAIPTHLTTSHDIDVPISVGGKVLYTKFKRIENKEYLTARIGESFYIRFAKSSVRKNAEAEIKYTSSPMLRTRARDLEFMLGYVNEGVFKIGDAELPFDFANADLSKFNVEEQSKQLERLKKAIKALDALGYSGDINLNELDAESEHNLDHIIDAFVDGLPITGLRNDLPPVVVMRIGKVKFLLCPKALDKEGIYELVDFGNTEVGYVVEDTEGNRWPVSQYSLLNAENMLSLSNIRFERLLPSFQNAPYHPETYGRATLFLLELIKAYDMSKDKRKDILRSAEDFANWIATAPPDEMDVQTARLNVLQIVKRNREFNQHEIFELIKISESEDSREDSKTAACLLLGNQAEAEKHFSMLPPDSKDEFKRFPIYRFWEKHSEELLD